VATLHVHLDEAGNFKFAPTGSRYFIFTITWTFDPEPLARALTALRFGLIKSGENLQTFHATTDRQAHRDQVIDVMTANRNWKYASLVIEKRKVNPSLRQPGRFYSEFASRALKFVSKGVVTRDTARVLFYTDRIPIQEKKSAVEAAIKKYVGSDLPKGMPFGIYHHAKESNAWIQATDYCCWGVGRKWESKDTRTYDSLRAHLETPELDAMRHGTTAYYSHD
jgi:hypothetical protein